VRIEATTEIVDLDATGVDLALRIGRGDWRGVRLRKLLPHRIFPVCAPALAEKLHTPADLRNVPAVLDSNAPGYWNPWLSQHNMTEADLGPGDSFTDAALCLDAAIAGQGVVMAWQTLAADALAAGLLKMPFPAMADTGTAYFAVNSASRPAGKRENLFSNWVAAEMEQTGLSFH